MSLEVNIGWLKRARGRDEAGSERTVNGSRGEFVLDATGRRGPARLMSTEDEVMNEKAFSWVARGAVVECAGFGSALESRSEL